MKMILLATVLAFAGATAGVSQTEPSAQQTDPCKQPNSMVHRANCVIPEQMVFALTLKDQCAQGAHRLRGRDYDVSFNACMQAREPTDRAWYPNFSEQFY
jgi:hypothetical protein